jgi:putative NADPH-quinone reductase
MRVCKCCRMMGPMSKRILIIDGHPDPAPQRYIHAIAAAYGNEARSAGHEVRTITVANLKFPVLRARADFECIATCPIIEQIQGDLTWCEHVVMIYPLWLGSLPALFKALLEQVFRPFFVLVTPAPGGPVKKWLRGKSVRIIVTMMMPALVYRWYFGAHSLKCLKRNVLSFCGMRPIRSHVIGSVGIGSREHHYRSLERIRRYARKAC